jgi:NTP pyrophosphatase (non-canonical NTP hydrolase)
MDRVQKIEALKDMVKTMVEERDWHIGENPKDMSMSIAIEAAELMEIFQWKTGEESAKIRASEEFVHLKEELADVIIYCIRMANMLDIDIYEMITDKIKKNAIKYPSKK